MFFGDRNLEKVTLPEGLTYIGNTAFADCGLFKFTIPATLTGLGSSVFSGCRRLSEFYVESGNQYYKAVDGVLFTKDGKTLVAYSMGDITSYYYVPAGQEVIASSAL
ncbi:MAG: leucine-rich repeat protein [Oscillospiraceae bacterium]|nr:leucine-rich repeat protein [Oscillospiraceae bacterium]